MACETKHPLHDEITMYKRKDDDKSPWQYRFYVSSEMNNGGKPFDQRKSTGKKDFKEACKVASTAYDGFSDAVNEGEQVTLSGKPTVADSFKHCEKLYLTSIANKESRPGTLQNIRDYYHRDVESYFGSRPVESVNSRMWNEFLAHLATTKPHLSKDAIRLSKVALQACLRAAADLNYIDDVPQLKPFMKASKKKPSKRIWFNRKEQKVLLAALEDNIASKTRKSDLYNAQSLRDFVHMMLYTGLRPEELRVLRCCDVQLKGMRDKGRPFQVTIITVREIEGSKTGSRMTKGVEGSGAAYKRILKRRGLSRDSKELLFDKNNRSKFVEILEDKKIRYDLDDKKRDFESLRHSFISNRLLEGEKLYSVSLNCGNSQKVIEDHYANHLSPLDFDQYKKELKIEAELRRQAGKSEDEEFTTVKRKTPSYKYDSPEQLERGRRIHEMLSEFNNLNLDAQAEEFADSLGYQDQDALNYYYSTLDT